MDIPLLTTKEVAKLLKVSHRTLETWRINGEKNLPVFHYKGTVRYHQKEVDKFVERQTRRNKSGKIQKD